MQFVSKTSSLSFTPAMESYVKEKIQKLSKYVDDLNGKAILNKEGSFLKLEISLPGNIRASRVGYDFYTLVTEVVEQLEGQIRKFKTIKRKEAKHSNLNFDYFEGDQAKYDVREKMIIKQEMSQEEAIENMELLGHSFFAYEDLDQRTTCVVYKRNDGGYGCLVLK
jgi:putative sigma-54 modulation protein